MGGLDEGEDGGVDLGPGVVLGDRSTRGFQRGGIVAGQIGGDDLPGHALVGGAMDVVGGDVEGIRIVRRILDREGPLEAVAHLVRALAHPRFDRPGRDVLMLSGAVVVTDESSVSLATTDTATDDDVVVGRLDGDVTALAAARLHPFGHVDGARD